MEKQDGYKYNNKGRCRRCNHRMMHTTQAGACPPRDVCPVCGYTDWSKVFFLTKGINAAGR